VIRQFLLLFLLAVPALILISCAPGISVPIGTIDFNQPGAKIQQTLLVFLPGIRDRAAVFADKGFVSAVRASGIEADMIGVEAHLDYYLKKQFLTRLKQDVIDPARQRGYRDIWLVGISLGGFGAIWYDIEHPGDLTGIVALAPYLGEAEVIDEVTAAGGLAGWLPADDIENDDQRKIWRGLKSYQSGQKSLNRFYLGYGTGDKFALPCGMLARILPPAQVFTTRGGHNWSSWRPIWDAILKSIPIATTAPEHEISGSSFVRPSPERLAQPGAAGDATADHGDEELIGAPQNPRRVSVESPAPRPSRLRCFRVATRQRTSLAQRAARNRSLARSDRRRAAVP